MRFSAMTLTIGEPGDYGARMPTFALVHGAWGVAREWDGVIKVLERLGHHAIAVDMPIDDTQAGLEDYADCLARATQHVREPVIVVGHSAGGYAAALLPARRPVQKVVFLAAFVPRPGEPFLVRNDGDPLDAASGCDFHLASPDFRSVIVDRGDGTCALDETRLATFLVGERAADMLVPMLRPLLRPHALRAFLEPFPRASLPDVPCVYLLTGADPVLPPASQRVFASRLGVEPIEVAGTDHGVHMKRPALVAQLLSRYA